MNSLSQTLEGVSATSRQRWALQPIAANGNWSGVVLTQPYPLPAPNRATYREIVEAITALIPESRSPFVPEAFLQMDRIDFRAETPIVQLHSDILGDYGLGIYPQMPPPAKWTREEFLAIFPPQKLRPLAHDIMQVDGGPAAIETIRNLFLGSGAYAQAFCAHANSFYTAATAVFKPFITDKLLRTFPYHAPMLQRRAIENATPDQLDSWTCGASLYMRESIEDNGLLILRRGDIEPLLRDLVEGRAYPDATFLMG